MRLPGVKRGFVSTRTQTDSAYTELRGGGAATNPFGFAHLLAALDFMHPHVGDQIHMFCGRHDLSP